MLTLLKEGLLLRLGYPFVIHPCKSAVCSVVVVRVELQPTINNLPSHLDASKVPCASLSVERQRSSSLYSSPFFVC